MMGYFYKGLAILMALVAVTAIIAGIFYRVFFEEEISLGVEKYGLIAIFVIFFLIEFIPNFVSPYFMMASGFFAGLQAYWLLPAILLGSFFGSLAGFYIGHKIRVHVVEELFGKKRYHRIHKGMNSYGRWYVLLSAITPLPYVPMIFGSLNLRYKNFLLFGVIPRTCWIVLIAFILRGIFNSVL